ncbi:MAG: hypothetical protein U0984_11495, partial [Prosthecobacter sp.]|nr:hypothetical protein [Prosthecobacter sp.]
YPDIKFGGSHAVIFWGTYLDTHVETVLDAAFAACREAVQGTVINPISAARDAGAAAENTIVAILAKMADADQKMRGEGCSAQVPRFELGPYRQRCLQLIERRTKAEAELAASLIAEFVPLPLSKDHGFWWFVFHCHWTTRLWMAVVFVPFLWAVFQNGFNRGVASQEGLPQPISAENTKEANRPTQSQNNTPPKQ